MQRGNGECGYQWRESIHLDLRRHRHGQHSELCCSANLYGDLQREWRQRHDHADLDTNSCFRHAAHFHRGTRQRLFRVGWRNL